MKWIALLLQLASFRSSLMESKVMIENAKAAAEKGKRAAMFSGVFLLALVYFLVGSILAVIELGLQVDRGQFFQFSGLFGACLILILIAAAIIGIGALAFGGAKPIQETPPREEPDLKSALEGVLVTFLTRFAAKLNEGGKKKGSDEDGA